MFTLTLEIEVPNRFSLRIYRSVIVGKENTDTRSIAQNDELLFFTNYESNNGQLKSWLHEHDTRYTKNGISEEIQGGVPVNRPNILVNHMDEFIIETQAGNLHYNMKWLNDDKGLLKKRAFLKVFGYKHVPSFTRIKLNHLK